MNLPWHLYAMASVYIFAGVNHFRNPRLYLKIIPPYFNNPKLLNFASGIAEIVLGLALCIPYCTTLASWGIITLLIAVFPANIYMLQNQKASMGLPKWILFLRLPLQLGLLYWAYRYTFNYN